MADIAMVFHWPPGAMAQMPVADLARWREKARERFEAQQAALQP